MAPAVSSRRSAARVNSLRSATAVALGRCLPSASAERFVQVGDRDLHAFAPHGGLAVSQASRSGAWRPSITSNGPAPSDVTDGGDPPGRLVRLRGEELRLINPDRRRGSDPGGVLDQGVAPVATASITVCQATPSWRAAYATVWTSAPTSRVAHNPARVVSAAPRRGDVGAVLGPGPRRARQLAARPAALGPHQPDRGAEGRQVSRSRPGHGPSPSTASRTPGRRQPTSVVSMATCRPGRRCPGRPRAPSHVRVPATARASAYGPDPSEGLLQATGRQTP